MRHALALLLAAPLMISAGPASYETRVANVLAKTPLIDGHNDWAETLVDKAGDARWTMDLTRLDPAKYNTDITRLRAGHGRGTAARADSARRSGYCRRRFRDR